MADFILSGQDDKLRRSPVIIGAEAHDVDPSHSGRKNSGKTRGGQEGIVARKRLRDLFARAAKNQSFWSVILGGRKIQFNPVLALPRGFLRSLDDLVRSRQHIRRNRQADLLRRFEVDNQLELGRLR